jgi:hypothetical protein
MLHKSATRDDLRRLAMWLTIQQSQTLFILLASRGAENLFYLSLLLFRNVGRDVAHIRLVNRCGTLQLSSEVEKAFGGGGERHHQQTRMMVHPSC